MTIFTVKEKYMDSNLQQFLFTNKMLCSFSCFKIINIIRKKKLPSLIEINTVRNEDSEFYKKPQVHRMYVCACVHVCTCVSYNTSTSL